MVIVVIYPFITRGYPKSKMLRLVLKSEINKQGELSTYYNRENDILFLGNMSLWGKGKQLKDLSLHKKKIIEMP